jgi:hypothetical protein
MKRNINEIKRMQQLAGIQLNEREIDDPKYIAISDNIPSSIENLFPINNIEDLDLFNKWVSQKYIPNFDPNELKSFEDIINSPAPPMYPEEKFHAEEMVEKMQNGEFTDAKTGMKIIWDLSHKYFEI